MIYVHWLYCIFYSTFTIFYCLFFGDDQKSKRDPEEVPARGRVNKYKETALVSDLTGVIHPDLVRLFDDLAEAFLDETQDKRPINSETILHTMQPG